MERLRRAEIALLIAFALFLVLLFVRGPTPGYSAPGYDREPLPEQLALGLSLTAVLMGVELCVFWLIMRPRSYRRSWRRSLLATALFLPWGLFCMMTVIHGPAFIICHDLWAFALGVTALSAFAISLVSSGLRAIRGRAAQRG